MIAPLARGQWLPAYLEFKECTQQPEVEPPGGKTYADVIEAILGLVYLKFGYEVSLLVADQLHATLPRGSCIPDQGVSIEENNQLAESVARCTGYRKFKHPSFLEEAFTHPSALHPTVPSYQRLEWIGDAVLCIAVREWIYKNFAHLALGDMVVMESALVANETLAFLCLKNGLQHHLNHRDQSLPSRIEAYDWSVRELGRGLWGADPPKSISDIVEAVFGAVHVDGGFEEGQKAVIQLISPILRVFLKAHKENKHFYVLKHPKKSLQELGGELLELYSFNEADFCVSKPATPVWFGAKPGKADPEGSNYIALVECIGSAVLAIADSSSLVARNRACSLLVASLEKNPDLMNRLSSARVKLESQISRAVEPKKRTSKARSAESSDDSDEDLFA